ncbi:MAG: HPr family phosphocarrier protein [Gammaproteobacteria bacterium]|jgi:phosphocarrier protein|nr:HPr family phosphocarrier protein [Gammaproteobacteria bacterium]
MELTKQLIIINKLGLHARAASKLVATASKFDCSVQINRNGQIADAKSIMSVLMLAASKGTTLDFTVNGHDAEEALQQIETLINNRFDEGE